MLTIAEILNEQQKFFKTNKTKSIAFRKKSLMLLRDKLEAKEEAICKALFDDFKKPKFESILTETAIVNKELKFTIKNIEKWAKPKKVKPSLLNFPSTDYIYSEPYGNVLIIAPWNYPYQLALAPLVNAIAAGNTVILKPSELTPKTSALIAEIIGEIFEPAHVAVVEGGVEESQQLLAQKWDYIFFTGSVKVGKIVAKAAAEHLTPVTLELGGKNPCIIDETANISLSAKRIVWGKFVNAGQTCIAPDYVLIHKKVKDEFVNCLRKEIGSAYGENPHESPDYARIINSSNYNRLTKMLENESISIGGKTDASTTYIAPTVIDEPNYLESEVMKDEIFGPILPIISYTEEKQVEAIIDNYAKPLSLYIFSNRKKFIKEILNKFSFGGGTVNDTIIHFVNHRLPFGGVGESGIGAYHGRKSFDIFSHKKAIVKRGNWIDPPIRYAPYGNKVDFIKKLLKWI